LACNLSQALHPGSQKLAEGNQGGVVEVWLRATAGRALVVLPGAVQADGTAVLWTAATDKLTLAMLQASDQLILRVRCAFLFDLRLLVFSSASKILLPNTLAGAVLPVLPGGVLESWVNLRNNPVTPPITDTGPGTVLFAQPPRSDSLSAEPPPAPRKRRRPAGGK
jgi:hypothetical protein